jgi:predicted RNA binding protein YcfA (HicA-like mRNA interferase family)
MPRLPPTSHAQLVAGLRRHGFDGLYADGKHLFMLKGELRLTIPNPHTQDTAPALLARILWQARILPESGSTTS